MANNSLKKFRVRTNDGGFIVITAKNAENAKTKARCQLGQLPNEINNQVSDSLLTILKNTNAKLHQSIKAISGFKKELDWDSIYKTIKDLQSVLDDDMIICHQTAGSLVKINKER